MRRIHLGHHFYGAGNLGDDFMLAGFLGALGGLAPLTTYTCTVPFALEPLQRRFPAIQWLPYDDPTRARCIAAGEVWLGLGGSPFQSAHSRWFIDHLLTEAELCRRERKPMFFLGVGVQSSRELAVPEVAALCAGATAIWTRDSASADRLLALSAAPPIAAAADVAHVFFRDTPPPPASQGRVTLVANFDFGAWPGQAACLDAVSQLGAREHIWLAQESRELPGAELALFGALSASQKNRWRLVSPENPGAPLPAVLANWPSGEWLITSRYHAAIAGAWAGSKVVIIGINEKLRAAARELGVPLIEPDADEATVERTLAEVQPATPPHALAQRAFSACEAFTRSAVAQRR